ncbi:MAG: arginine--tRNA ligase [Candidatus Zixiibacteriota bacterium]
MVKDRYQKQFAEAVSAAFKAAYPDAPQPQGESDAFGLPALLAQLVPPKDPTMGRFCLPVFRYSRLLRQKPADIAARLGPLINKALSSVDAASSLRCESIGGYLNARIDPVAFTTEVLSEILTRGNRYGDSDLGKGQINLVEYSSPNIAKPFGIGHLRSTIIGHSLRRIYKKLGYHALGINYPGDWGTQFGKMIVAFRKWGSEEMLQGDAVKNLLQLYVRFHREAHENPALEDEARLAFKELEQGGPSAVALWERFKQISYAEFNRIYGLLGIEFDWTYGESVLNDRMEAMIQRLERAGLTSRSQGALVVDLGETNLPPLLLRKSDGATLYATRDLAGIEYRWEKYPGFHESLYVVNVAQSDHFKQCFKVIAKLEDAEQVPPDKRMSGRIRHVDFGWVRFDGQMMSTRRGNTVLLEDVINEAARLSSDMIREKNPELPDADKIARMVGVGAVIFSQLSLRRQRDIDFRWAEVLNFDGETGPYLQYTHARLCSVIRKYGAEITRDVDLALLNQPEEQRVIELLADFPGVVVDAGEQYEPYFISSHLLKLGSAFNKVYQRKDEQGRIDKIISDNADLTTARMALVKSVQTVINEGLYLLGLQAPEAM